MLYTPRASAASFITRRTHAGLLPTIRLTGIPAGATRPGRDIGVSQELQRHMKQVFTGLRIAHHPPPAADARDVNMTHRGARPDAPTPLALPARILLVILVLLNSAMETCSLVKQVVLGIVPFEGKGS